MSPKHMIHPKYKHYGIFVCTLGALFYCYEYLLRIEPSVMMPHLMHSFHIGAEGFGWLVGMYYYAYTPMQAVVGISTDYWGPRKVLVMALALCSVGCWMFAATNNVMIAGFGRLLIGMGSSFAFVCALKLASLWLPANRFALFAGIATGLGMLGAMVGDVGMQYVVSEFGWRHVLIGSALVGVVLIPIFWFCVIEKHEDSEVHFAVSQSFKQLLSGLVAMIHNAQLWISGIIGCMMYLSLSAFAEIWGIPFLDSLSGVNHALAAKLNAFVFLGWLIGSPFSGWLSDRLKSRRIPLVGGSLLAALCFSILLMAHFENPYLFAGFLFAFGFFCSNEILCFAVARESTPLPQAATAIGFTNLLIMLGGMVMQPLVGTLLDWSWNGTYNEGIRVYSSLDFHRALVIIPIAMVVSAALGLFLKESYRD